MRSILALGKVVAFVVLIAALTWSLAACGTEGSAGPAGSQGPAGPAGLQGPAGPQGAAGAAGAEGAAGPAGSQGPAGPAGGSLAVSPASVVAGEFDPIAILVTPMEFTGAGFEPGETVAIELIIGTELAETLPKIAADTKTGAVGLGFAVAGDAGTFKMAVGGLTKIVTLLGADYDLSTGGPAFEGMMPVPVGLYTLVATGMTSGVVASCPWEFTAPAE